MFFQLLGILGAVLLIVGDIPYVVDTFKGKTKPHRVTWGIVVLVNGIGFANQLASGASNSLWGFGAATFITGVIFLSSLKFGTGGHSRNDMIALLASLVGVGLWVIFDSPLFSIVANVFVAIISLLPTIAKAKMHPETETKVSWLLGSIASTLTMLSVGALNWRLIILPLVGALLQAYMVYILYFETRNKKPIKAVDVDEAKRNIL